MRKVFIDINVNFTKDGDLSPVYFIWDNGIKYTIDKVFECSKATSLKVGGHGIRYRCKVMGKEVYLFLEDGRWFMEGK